MTEHKGTLERLSDEEIEAQTGDELPDRKAMSTVSCDPSEFGIVAIDELPEPPEPADR